LKFNRHHCLERFYRFADGVIKYSVDDMKCSAPQSYAVTLCRILQTLAQNIVFGYDLGNVETCLPSKQAMFCGNDIRFTMFISHIEGFSKVLQKLRYFVIDCWRIEAGRTGELSHLLTPASKQCLMLRSDENGQSVYVLIFHWTAVYHC